GTAFSQRARRVFEAAQPPVGWPEDDQRHDGRADGHKADRDRDERTRRLAEADGKRRPDARNGDDARPVAAEHDRAILGKMKMDPCGIDAPGVRVAAREAVPRLAAKVRRDGGRAVRQHLPVADKDDDEWLIAEAVVLAQVLSDVEIRL